MTRVGAERNRLAAQKAAEAAAEKESLETDSSDIQKDSAAG